MDRIALCAIFKNEAPYLLEWIAFHRMIGVDHFVLYDNSSDDGGGDLIRRSPFASYVTLIDWPDRPGQFTAYADFIERYARTFAWVGFIDLDEFIHPVEANALREILRHPRYQDFSCILLHWLMFGPSGHDRRPDGLVIDLYDQRTPDDNGGNQHVKSLVRGTHLRGVTSTPHTFVTEGDCCSTLGVRIPSHAVQPVPCHAVMVINHYFTRSREDWENKLARGRADMADERPNTLTMEVLDHVTVQAVVPDRRITRFLPRLRWVMR